MALAPRKFSGDTHEVSAVLWAYLCSVEYAGANTIYMVLEPRSFPVDTHKVSELLWVYLCGVGYGGSKTNIWH